MEDQHALITFPTIPAAAAAAADNFGSADGTINVAMLSLYDQLKLLLADVNAVRSVNAAGKQAAYNQLKQWHIVKMTHAPEVPAIPIVPGGSRKKRQSKKRRNNNKQNHKNNQ